MGRISRAKRPSSRAWIAFSCERRPRSSQSWRVMPRFFAMRSADWNWSGVESHGQSAVWKKPGPLSTLAPRPDVAHDLGQPHAMPTSMLPALTSAEIRWFACWPEPHCASTVVPATP